MLILKRFAALFFIITIFFSFCLNILGLMNLFPLYLSSPLLFLTFFGFLFTMNNRNKFRGFR
ncbi:hypothetical protein P9H20_06625 [Lederbergia lenta]|nr:hypothetical protein [Lederbergia lenta]MEC2323985.1 hypothetical protein [Lederbergia lenta]